MFGDTPGQGERVKVHQPKRAVPESAEDQTLETPAAARGVQWGAAAAAEGPDGADEQPQLVSLVSFSIIKVFKILLLLAELTMFVVSVVSSLRFVSVSGPLNLWSVPMFPPDPAGVTAPHS